MAIIQTPLCSESMSSALASLFSSTVVREMARTGQSRSFSRVVNELGIGEAADSSASVEDALDAAFAHLARCHRNEYVFKTALALRILIGRHSLNTAVLMTEFRVDECKADVVILNGTSTAYEIKSDRDKLDRLSSQIASYRRVFAHVNVVTADRHLDQVAREIPDDVGIMRLNSRLSLSTLRASRSEPARVDPQLLFDSIRLEEAQRILRLLGVSVPKVPNTKQHSTLRPLFGSLVPSEVHQAMVEVLRKTRSHRSRARFLNSLPQSMLVAALTTGVRRQDCTRLVSALRTPIKEAVCWE